MKNLLVNIAMGLLFGGMFARAGVHEFAHIHGMFTFTDFHMYGVLGCAVGVAALGIFLFKKYSVPMANGLRFSGKRKERHPGNIPGGLLFGAGWAITGACPGIVFVQVGSGYLLGISTMIGLTLGVLLYRPFQNRYLGWEANDCG